MPMVDMAREVTYTAEFKTEAEALAHMEWLKDKDNWIGIDLKKPTNFHSNFSGGWVYTDPYKVIATKMAFGKEFRMFDPSLMYICNGCPDCDGNGNLIDDGSSDED